MSENSLFISDLHLAPERPEIIKLFTRFVDEVAKDADNLFILGDFLEYWIGDDDPAEGLDNVFSALQRLHDTNTRVFMMHGNRDFLMGKKLAKRCGFTLIGDPYPLNINSQTALLMHGDLLCSDDIAYQKFRRKARNPIIRALFKRLPLSVREKIAMSLRETSSKETAKKSEYIMDVNQQTVENTMRQFNTSLLIHGHTHRPGIHEFTLDNQPASRIVLGDWYKHGNYLKLNDNNEFELVQFS
jgi:UDP-2,3-diacylglucosamine hydrolase